MAGAKGGAGCDGGGGHGEGEGEGVGDAAPMLAKAQATHLQQTKSESGRAEMLVVGLMARKEEKK